MFKAIAAATATVALALGLSLAAVAPASAEGESNDPSFYQTPGTSEICQKFTPSGDITTVTATSFSIPAGDILTKVIIKAGNTGASGQGPENHGYYTDSTYEYPAAYTDLDWVHVSDLSSTTFSHPSGKNISHAIYCYIPAPPTDVAGAAAATNPVCTDNEIVSGFITVTITTGVTYVITNNADGTHTPIPFDGTTGKTGDLPAGSYTVAASPSSSAYHLTSAESIPLTIAANPTDCGKVSASVTPSAIVTDQTCNTQDLEKPFKVNGFITVGNLTGVTYTITADKDATHTPIPYDAVTGKTGLLVPGGYTVHPAAKSGFTLSSAADIRLTIAAYDGPCTGLDTHPLVDPSAVQQQIGCNTDGSYTLSSDQQDPAAVVWTVNGSIVSQGTYVVTTAGTYHVVAAPGPGFGFAKDTQTTWDFTFGVPTTCDLKTLALTGSADGMPMLAASGLFMLLGVALVRSGLRTRRRNAAS